MGRKKKTRVPEEESDEDVRENRGGESSTGKERSLYEILGVERTATQQEIKKAYYKLALRLHPDKNPGDEEAKEKFQHLQRVISILGDEEKRALYDQTGCVDDAELVGDVVDNLREFFRAMYKKVTVTDIEEFEANYRGSETEKKDLKDLYKKYKGNMNSKSELIIIHDWTERSFKMILPCRLFCTMLCSDPKLDSHRFKSYIDDTIAEGELKSSKAYEKWAKEVLKIKPPTEPLASRKKYNKQAETGTLAGITERRSERKDRFNSMFSSMISKYCGGNAAPEEPTEEEFEMARKRFESHNKSSKKQKR